MSARTGNVRLQFAKAREMPRKSPRKRSTSLRRGSLSRKSQVHEANFNRLLGFKDGYLGLYQDLESQKRGITTNAVQVGLAESYDVDVRKLRKLVGKHVMVQGGYHRESGLQFASGTIEAVRIYSLPVKLVE